MHCSNCSQTLLQRFNDAVITFIRQAKYTNDTRYSSIYTVINVGERVSKLTSFLWTILSTACPNIELVNSYLSLFSKVGWLFFTHMYCWHDIGVSYLLRWPEMNYCDTVVTANTLFTHDQDPSLPPLSSPPVSLVSLKKQSISFSRKGAHKTVLTLIHHCLPLPLLSYTHPDPPLPTSPSSLLYSPWSMIPRVLGLRNVQCWSATQRYKWWRWPGGGVVGEGGGAEGERISQWLVLDRLISKTLLPQVVDPFQYAN